MCFIFLVKDVVVFSNLLYFLMMEQNDRSETYDTNHFANLWMTFLDFKFE